MTRSGREKRGKKELLFSDIKLRLIGRRALLLGWLANRVISIHILISCNSCFSCINNSIKAMFMLNKYYTYEIKNWRLTSELFNVCWNWKLWDIVISNFLLNKISYEIYYTRLCVIFLVSILKNLTFLLSSREDFFFYVAHRQMPTIKSDVPFLPADLHLISRGRRSSFQGVFIILFKILSAWYAANNYCEGRRTLMLSIYYSTRDFKAHEEKKM